VPGSTMRALPAARAAASVLSIIGSTSDDQLR
jgi:hypothetical protein